MKQAGRNAHSMDIAAILQSMDFLEKPVEYRPSRPPTAVYPDRHQVAEYRRKEFPPTAVDWERIFCINLEGGFFSPSALIEMIVPLGQAMRGGTYGSAALVVVTSDEGTIEFIEALAERHELPIFLSQSPETPLAEARPVGALTPAEVQTYSLIRKAGGQVTSSRVADLAGIEVNAAVNRLSTLAKKGYLHRITRPRREGDAFVDLLSAAQQNAGAVAVVDESTIDVDALKIPDEVRQSVEAVASIERSKPEEMLVRAWREFMERHQETLGADSQQVREMFRTGDREAIAGYLNRSSRDRAKKAIARLKRK